MGPVRRAVDAVRQESHHQARGQGDLLDSKRTAVRDPVEEQVGHVPYDQPAHGDQAGAASCGLTENDVKHLLFSDESTAFYKHPHHRLSGESAAVACQCLQ